MWEARLGLTSIREESNPPLRVAAALIGAQKSGTTTLSALLATHPKICLARDKEAHLFDREDVQSSGLPPELLNEHFPDYQTGQILLDATPSYLYLPGCIEALVKHSPDVRLVVILRHPAQRALSHHGHERRLGFEDRGFLLALLREKRRLRRDTRPLDPESAHRHHSYADRGRYHVQLARLAQVNVKHHVVLFKDLLGRTQSVMDEICDFLEVDRLSVEGLPHLNAGDNPTNRVSRFIAKVVTRRSLRMTEKYLSLSRGAL
jgi:hypothetical protein